MKHRFIIKVNKSELESIIVFALFFMPASYVVSDPIYYLWSGIVCAVSVYYVAVTFFRRKATKDWMVFCLFYSLYYVVSSALQSSGGNIFFIILYFLKGIGLITFAELKFKENFKKGLISFTKAGLMMCSVHYLTFLIYRNIRGGMQHGYYVQYRRLLTNQHWFFFTHDNGSIFIFLPVLCALWLIVFEYKQFRKTAVVATVLSLYMYISLNSVAAMIIMLAFTAGLLFFYLRRNRLHRGFNYFTVNITGLLANIFVIFLNSINVFSVLSERFGKAWSLSSRSKVWNASLYEIANHFWLGHGHEEGIVAFSKIGINHCHNILLQIFYNGGVFCFICFVVWVVLIRPSGNSKYRTSGHKICLLSILLIWIASIFDWYAYFPIQFLVLLMLKYYDNYQIGKARGLKETI